MAGGRNRAQFVGRVLAAPRRRGVDASGDAGQGNRVPRPERCDARRVRNLAPSPSPPVLAQGGEGPSGGFGLPCSPSWPCL